MLSSWPFTDQATLSRGKASTVVAGFRLSQQFDGLAHVVGLACLQGRLPPVARQCDFEGIGSGVASRTYLTSTYIVGGAPQAQSMVSFYLIKIKLKRRKRAEEIGA